VSDTAPTDSGTTRRLIDRWFPCSAVDEAVTTPFGSGRSEKAIFTWFASRPIAQARAAVLTALLPDDDSLRGEVDAAVRSGDREALAHLAKVIDDEYPDKRPVVLDVFSGRGIIPLEAARVGAVSVGIDLSPVATLAGRLLADYPMRDWSAEPPLPFQSPEEETQASAFASTPRLLADVKTMLHEVGRRVAEKVEDLYPRNSFGQFPWGYLWTITMTCDGCHRRFPLIGSYLLRHPNNKTGDLGQAFALRIKGETWGIEIIEGAPTQEPTYSSSDRGDGKKRKGKAARCPFCRHIHPLDTVKAKGFGGEYEDQLIAVADYISRSERAYRLPTPAEQEAIGAVNLAAASIEGCPYPAVPDESIPEGNVHTVMASGYGYRHFGELMCARQTISFVETAQAIREIHRDLLAAGISEAYAGALAAYAAATLCRRLRRSTRGARLMQHGSPAGTQNNRQQVDHIFSNESKINFQFDFFEAGPGDGPGTWGSVSTSAVQALEKVIEDARGHTARLRRASATALPYRDGTVDAVITDPPYYDMIEYADASDFFHVWLKRVLFDIEPDLFGPDAQQRDGLQNKDDEIIVRRVHEPGRVRHDNAFYEAMLAKSFAECRRVLRPDGHLVVVFGHSDPDAWRRLLGALHDAGFVVTSAWPSRTETTNTGVASIRVTVAIGCRVAATGRPAATRQQADREVVALVTGRVRQWVSDGLALNDQLMAAYGPAMEVYGRYEAILAPDGTTEGLDRYLTLARQAVRDATTLQLDEIPLETFDAATRLAVFMLRHYGRTYVPKGEDRFLAHADELRIEDLRGPLVTENKAGFKLRTDAPSEVTAASSTFEVARAVAAAWAAGGTEAVAAIIAAAEREPTDPHLWAVIGDLVAQLPASDGVAKALTAVQRNTVAIANLVGRQTTSLIERERAARTAGTQLSLADDTETP
jgi:adenine-specific DNA methylase